MANALQSLKIAAEQLKNKYTLTPLQCSLREATNNENWSTDTKILQEIADASYNYNDFNVVTKFIWERLTSKSKNWRKVVKTLNMIEYLLKNGAPRCINEFRDEIFQIRSFQDFQCFDEGVDRGAAVRERSKAIVELLNDETQLDQERDKAKKIREKLSGIHGLSQGAHERPQYDGFSNKTFNSSNTESSTKKTYSSNTSSSNRDSDKHYDDDNFQGNLDRFRKKEEMQKEKERQKQSESAAAPGSIPSKEEEKPQPAFQASVFRIPQPGEQGDVTVVPTTNTSNSQTVAPPSGKGNSLIDFDEPKNAAPTSSTVQNDPFGNWGEMKAAVPPPTNSSTNSSNTDFSWGWETAKPSNPPAPVAVAAPAPTINTFPTQTTAFPMNTNQFPLTFNAAPPVVNNSSPFNFTAAPVMNPVSTSPFISNTNNINNINLVNNSNNFNFTPAPVVNNPTNTKKQSDDGFGTFESANKKEDLLPGLNQREARIIDLSNLKQDQAKKKEEKANLNKNTFGGLDKSNSSEPNMLYTTQQDLDSFSLFGATHKNSAPTAPPTFNQAPNYNALYMATAPAPQYGYNTNPMMYPNNMGMQGMGYAPTGNYNQFQTGGGMNMNQGYGNPQPNYSNPNAFNFH